MTPDPSGGTDYWRGDVVWSADPFKAGDGRERLWLIVSTDRHPFHPEQYVAVAVTTTPLLVSHPLRDRYWEVGGTPKPSYVSPWAVHSPRREDIVAPPSHPEIGDPWQGRLGGSFVDSVVEELVHYVR